MMPMPNPQHNASHLNHSLTETKNSHKPSESNEFNADDDHPKGGAKSSRNQGNEYRTSKSTKSLSLELSSEMHKTLKVLALKQDDTLNSLVIEALKQFIENDELMNLKAEALRKRLS